MRLGTLRVGIAELACMARVRPRGYCEVRERKFRSWRERRNAGHLRTEKGIEGQRRR